MGKGGGKAHTPREAKDNLKSTQMMSVIDAIGEGPIEGPVKGLQSILVNKTPLTDTDGNPVIHGVTAVWRAGEQEQTPPEGFESSGAETGLGVEVTKAKPVTRTITSANIDRLRVTFGVQSLVETTSKGDRNPSSVRLLIQLQRNGNWVTEKDVTINGKTTSQFLASVILDNLPPRPFNIRMVRETADSTTDQLQNRTLWSSYTEIIDVKQCYPNTAIVGMQVDAEQFGGQQMTVNYHIRGRIIQVPSNYDPEKRTYSGIWDGSLKPAYSNNPAWCLWDMLTHPRYGMGKRLGAADVDKWALYAIGQYCDQTVPDGFGGTEPRMTFNAYLAQQRKAWDVLSDFCSAMRCMPVWNGQTLTVVQDRPSDVVWPYTNSDVVVDDNGVGFRYSFSALKDRHTAVEVNYTDPQNGWQTSTELVEDPEAILRYGRNLLKMDAFGCTSRGQAHRAGLWVIKTELLETQTVDFTLGSQGLRHTPGDIIEICDNDYAGTLTGGRVLSIDAATRTLTLDREVTLPETGAATVNLINGSGKQSRHQVKHPLCTGLPERRATRCIHNPQLFKNRQGMCGLVRINRSRNNRQPLFQALCPVRAGRAPYRYHPLPSLSLFTTSRGGGTAKRLAAFFAASPFADFLPASPFLWCVNCASRQAASSASFGSMLRFSTRICPIAFTGSGRPSSIYSIP